MGANKTDEIKKTSYEEGKQPKPSANPKYDNDEGGATGWFTHVNALPGQQKARKC